MIRAKTELGVIEDLLDRVYVNRALLISRQRTLKRRVLDLQQVLNG